MTADDYLTTGQAARSLGLARWTIEGAIQRGALSAIHFGKWWAIHKDEVERYRRENLGRHGNPNFRVRVADAPEVA